MGHWQDRLVFFRDFAYPRRRRSRMANGNIGDAPASSFAEYVDEPRFESSSADSPHPPPAAGAIPGATENKQEAGAGPQDGEKQSAPSRRDDSVPTRTRRHSHGRPTLAHRIYTQNLRVQAYAKSLRARLLSGPLVEVYVGPSKQQWSLHRNLLCHHSERLSGELLPSERNKHPELRIDLPSDDPAGFELLVKWLYQGKLDDVSDIADSFDKYEYAVSCYRLWLICDRFDMPQLKNHAIDQYRKGLHEAELVPDADEIHEIYRSTPPGSPFRRLMAKIAARQIMDPYTSRDANTYRECFSDPDFAIEMVNAVKNESGGILFDDPTQEGDRCTYHDHEEEPGVHLEAESQSQVISKAADQPTPADPHSRATSKNHQRHHSHQPTLDPLAEMKTHADRPPTPPLTPPLPRRRQASDILHRRISETSAMSLASSLISPLHVIAHRRSSKESKAELTPDSILIPQTQPQRPLQDAIPHHPNSDAKATTTRENGPVQSWWAVKWQW